MYAELREEVPLITPGITIMSVGTEIRYGDTMEPDHGWEEELNQGWDREAIVEEGKKLNLKFQVRQYSKNMVYSSVLFTGSLSLFLSLKT